jgi:hypothetical protein
MLYANTDTALKKLILQAVPIALTQELKDSILGYANGTTLKILTHLYTTYDIINEDDLDRNLAELNKPWDVNSPIEALYYQIRTCITFTAATYPISAAKRIRVGLQLFETTKGFTDAVRDWRKKAIAARTLDNFETHFTAANVERKSTLTVRGAGYAAAATTNRENEPNAVNQAGQKNTNSATLYYCWSHVTSHNASHIGTTCNRPAPGHKADATIHQMLGGCNIIQRSKGERQVFVRPARPTSPAPTTELPI